MSRRTLSEGEKSLWRRAMSDVRPARRKPTPLSADAPLIAQPPPKPAKPQGGHARSFAPILPSVKHDSAQPRVLGAGDPALDRRAGARRIAVDRTLDLHGMTQREAHAALIVFLAAAVADGARLALIITGKSGVLRARFIGWIEASPARGSIARVAPARPRDGGAGAFYVHLKKKSAALRRP